MHTETVKRIKIITKLIPFDLGLVDQPRLRPKADH